MGNCFKCGAPAAHTDRPDRVHYALPEALPTVAPITPMSAFTSSMGGWPSTVASQPTSPALSPTRTMWAVTVRTCRHECADRCVAPHP